MVKNRYAGLTLSVEGIHSAFNFYFWIIISKLV